MTDRRRTVILADDHPLMMDGLHQLLQPAFNVVATAKDGLALIDAAARLQPDLVVADISMPGVDGIEATRRLASICPATRVVILSFYSEPSWVRTAFEAGAWGYLTKTVAPAEIEEALREVLGGRFYLSPSVTRALVLPPQMVAELAREALPASKRVLTPREQDVVHLVGQGLPNKKIAISLGVSVTTVRTHLSSAYDKLGRENRVELALYAARTAGIAD